MRRVRWFSAGAASAVACSLDCLPAETLLANPQVRPRDVPGLVDGDTLAAEVEEALHE